MAGNTRIRKDNEELKKFNGIDISYYDYSPNGDVFNAKLLYPAIWVPGHDRKTIFDPRVNGWIEDPDWYDELYSDDPSWFKIVDRKQFMRRLVMFKGWLPFEPKDALEFAAKAHEGQFRKDGVTPYIEHPKAVVRMLNSWGITHPILICAAYLHDVLEDTSVTDVEMNKHFTFIVSNIVKKLTRGNNEAKVDYLKRISECHNAVVLLIKCADRVCNTRDFIRDGKVDYARTYFHEEVLDLFKPVAWDDKKDMNGILDRLISSLPLFGKVEFHKLVRNILSDGEIIFLIRHLRDIYDTSKDKPRIEMAMEILVGAMLVELPQEDWMKLPFEVY